MDQTDLSGYKNIYMETAKEYVDKMSVCLDKLTQDPSDKEALNNLHIASHSLKSQSQVMGYNDISDICLSIEKMSDDALKEIAQLNSENIAEIKASVGKLNEILKRVQDDTGVTI